MHKINTVLFIVIILILVGSTGCIFLNHPPEIASLESGSKVIGPSNSCLIECLAWDQDGDDILYSWTANDGKITKMNKEGSKIAWTAPKKEGLYNISVQVDDGKTKNAVEASQSISIIVKDNHAPLITEMKAYPEWVLLGEECQLSCDAEDEDGDQLSYKWSVEAGTLSGEGKSVKWLTPEEEGLYEATVVVDDGFGKEDTRIVSVSVSQYPPPAIEEITITPEQPKYFREENGFYRILRERKCTIECVVADAHENLTFEWSYEDDRYRGEDEDGKSVFSGEGPVITWTAPSKGVKATITVYVSDQFGYAASKSISIKVETCGCAFK